MLSTTDKGNIAEHAVTADLLSREYIVLFPLGGQPHYDLVSEKDGKFLKIQVKYVKPKKGVLGIRLYTVIGQDGKENNHKDKVDIYAVYNPDNKTVYYLYMVDFPNSKQINLRVTETKNSQTKGCFFA